MLGATRAWTESYHQGLVPRADDNIDEGRRGTLGPRLGMGDQSSEEG
jgi:hypothetical protein